MERLTNNKSWQEGYSNIWKRLNDIENILGEDYNLEELKNKLDKLRQYEQAEQKGTLLTLPCKEILESQGDYLYMIYDGEIIQLVNCNMTIEYTGVIYVTCHATDKIFPYQHPCAEYDTEISDWCTEYIDFELSDFGKTVFLTKEEAETALKQTWQR